MTYYRVVGLLLLLCVSGVTGAQGLPRNLRVVPNPAVAGQPVVARLLQGCNEGSGSPATVAVAGNVVTLTQVADSICLGTPPPPSDFDYPLGAFPQGAYSLQYFFRDMQGNVAYQESTTFQVGASGNLLNIRVIPNPAMAGQPLFARLHINPCLGLLPPAPVIVNGTQVSLNFTGLGGCPGVPPPPQDFDFPLGAFAAASYNLTVTIRNGAGTVVLQESAPFQVGAASGVPVMTPVLLLLLAAAFAAIGLRLLAARP